MDLKQNPPQKVLVINIFGIGDVLFTTPFISNLKANFPNVKVSYLCNQRSKPVLENYRKLDKIFVYERDYFLATWKKSKLTFFKEGKKLFDLIKQEKFDTVFDFSLNSTVDIAMWLIGIKRRIGLNYRNRSRLLTKKYLLEAFESKHVAEYYLDILRDLGLKIHTQALEMDIAFNDEKWADDFLKSGGFSTNKQLIGILPGGGASWGKEARYRRWDPEKFGKLLDKLIEKPNTQIILFGDKKEADLCQKLLEQREKHIIAAYGKTTLSQLSALFKRCRLLVLNDGGPLHVASASGTKTVSIFGPVDDIVYGPYGDSASHRVVKKNFLCSPCYRRFRMTDCTHISCLEAVSVDDVWQTVKEALNE